MSQRRGGYLAPTFTPMAHRGGALLPVNLGIENTLTAFGNAVDLGFDYLETDVHVTRDGVLVAFHDSSLSRVADLDAEIADLTFEELGRISIGGREHVPSLDELFDAFPACSFNLDIKAPGAVEPLAQAIASHGADARVCVGSFSPRRLGRFRKLRPQVVTSASPPEAAWLAVNRVPRSRLGVPRVYQVPMTQRVGPGSVRLVTPKSVAAVHSAGRRIHVWTIDDPLVMHQLIDWGVDGIVTDRPDLLKLVMRERGMWSTRFAG